MRFLTRITTDASHTFLIRLATEELPPESLAAIAREISLLPVSESKVDHNDSTLVIALSPLPYADADELTERVEDILTEAVPTLTTHAETYSDSIFGEIYYDDDYQCFCAEIELENEEIDVRFDGQPDNFDRDVLQIAHGVVTDWENKSRRFKALIAENHLAEYNSDWITHDPEAKGRLGCDEFIDRLSLCELRFYGNRDFGVLYYSDEMFGTYDVAVRDSDGNVTTEIAAVL